jgi:hypothetical protein
MTAFTDDDAAAAARAAEVRALIDRAQSEDVFLTMLSAMDLCALGGPKQALFDEAPARAWGSLRPKGRNNLPGVIFEDLEERGLLIRQAPTVPLAAPGGHAEPQAQDYAFSPKLGVVLAARSRPAIAVTCELQQLPTRHPRLFALGDEQDPVRALVREAPVAPPPGDYPHLRKAGPLAWFYQYDLVSKPSAAAFLAGWALLRSEARPKSARLVTALRNDGARFLTVQTLAIYTNDGTTARLDGAQYNKAELTAIMSALLNPQQQTRLPI